MSANLEGNEKLQRFLQLLSDLNHETVDVLRTGDTQILRKMNDTVDEMYAIQHGSKEEEYVAVDEAMQVVYKNFNAIATMMNTNESIFVDNATSGAVKKFLHNIFNATVDIVHIYGLA